MGDHVPGNQGKIGFFKRIYVLFKGRFPIADKTKEGVMVKTLKNQIRLLEQMNDKQSRMIEDMTERLSVSNNESIQEKMLTMVGNLLSPSKKPTISGDAKQTTLTNTPDHPTYKVDLDDNKISAMLNQYEPSAIKSALALGDDFLKGKIREAYPELSEKSIDRGLEIAKSM